MQLEICLNIFLIKKCNLLIPRPSPKDAQATGEAFSPQMRTSTSTSKHENSLLFSIVVGHFCPSDPDPATEINADPQPCLDGLYLLADGGEGSLLEPVELVEAAPGAHLAQAHKDPAHRLEIEGLVAVEDQDKPDKKT